MKAVLISEPGSLQVIEREVPQITSDTAVLVKIQAAGICGSDVHILHGTHAYATYPRIVGHEGCGVVEAVGSAVTGFQPGDAVIIEPIHSCGTCYTCRHGHYNCCPNIVVAGVHCDGLMAEYAVVESRQLFKYDPAVLTPVQAALAEPYTVGAQACAQGNVMEGDLVLVHGAGPIGTIICDMAASMGAKVIISEVSDSRREMAAAFGASCTINPLQENLSQCVAEISEGMGVNVVFETTGVPALTTNSIPLLSPHGRFVPLTFAPEPMPIDFRLVNKNELVIAGTRNQNSKFQGVVDSLPSRKDRLDKLVSHVFPVAEAAEAFDVAANPKSGSRKVIITFA
ncbi:MAG: alcohol dehydrogenase catalytic domain-containing protein [Lawsonibacter sp.]|nr:alcohol dehydrogenase catalytic domain-containing protein [Lawsonibacter sp.]